MWDDGGWGPGEWILMTTMMIVVWGGLDRFGGLAGSLVSANQHAGQTPTNAIATADQVLAERFARGEIDESEFKRRRDLLRAG